MICWALALKGKTMEMADRKTLLHLLRNPYGWSDDVVREARLKAANEIERLWLLEANCAGLTRELYAELVPDGKPWKARLGWSKILEGLRKSLPRVGSFTD